MYICLMNRIYLSDILRQRCSAKQLEVIFRMLVQRFLSSKEKEGFAGMVKLYSLTRVCRIVLVYFWLLSWVNFIHSQHCDSPRNAHLFSVSCSAFRIPCSVISCSESSREFCWFVHDSVFISRMSKSNCLCMSGACLGIIFFSFCIFFPIRLFGITAHIGGALRSIRTRWRKGGPSTIHQVSWLEARMKRRREVS